MTPLLVTLHPTIAFYYFYYFCAFHLLNYTHYTHNFKKVNQSVDFSFVASLTEDLYCPNNSRPSIAPESYFRMILLSYLYSIKSTRKLIDEILYIFVYQCQQAGLVEGLCVMTDSTFIQAMGAIFSNLATRGYTSLADIPSEFGA
ncbi:transposase [Legionella clemsonensis]|uniref:Transposase InsH N-terminal domain-containing protein n=1 Tax=Legionella clemsonensis TaxID=1867846 RepID=A0A222NZF7_9GAMM|nr:hypothetical protein clem_01965 [Legionella clemsonensis]